MHRKLQQIVRICCWQNHFRNDLPDKPMTILENIFKYKLFIWLLFKSKLQQKWEYVVDNIIFGPSYPINLWKSLKTHLNENFSFDYFLIVTTRKSVNMLLTISYSDRLTRLTYDNTFLCILFILFLFIRKQQQKKLVCRWQ